ncbi:hypothetical protein GCM10010384_09380 [Streptomyces djakartensis]|uniref:Uncharacterized protein n=1 Tax=Streptomyces djakartensis TaxID=68193 RepID=A0ABQ2Z9U8_9ACTN|nr:hypothetical protein GCM10010384_09380 [Streptomyces djakartensis]
MLPLQCGELVLGGRLVGESGSGRHGRMPPQGAARAQGTYPAVRRTVDRVDERFDERSTRPAMRVPEGPVGVSEPREAARAFFPVCA